MFFTLWALNALPFGVLNPRAFRHWAIPRSVSDVGCPDFPNDWQQFFCVGIGTRQIDRYGPPSPRLRRARIAQLDSPPPGRSQAVLVRWLIMSRSFSATSAMMPTVNLSA